MAAIGRKQTVAIVGAHFVASVAQCAHASSRRPCRTHWGAAPVPLPRPQSAYRQLVSSKVQSGAARDCGAPCRVEDHRAAGDSVPRRSSVQPVAIDSDGRGVGSRVRTVCESLLAMARLSYSHIPPGIAPPLNWWQGLPGTKNGGRRPSTRVNRTQSTGGEELRLRDNHR